MPDCDYCDQSFPDEGSLLEHMGEAHEGELGRIDQRRVDDHYGDDGGVSTTVIYAVVGIVFVAIVGGAVYAAVGAFSGPSDLHEHGTIEMTVAGESVDFDQSPYYSPQEGSSQDFHFHRTGSDDAWHMHPADDERMTITEAMGILGIEVTEDSVTYQGETYSADEPNTTISVLVDGEPEDPASYELQGAGNSADGDHVEIAVEADA